jgi:Na+/phosphate symporter
MVGNTAAKRAARAHLVFNVVGVILTLLVLKPELSLIANVTEAATGISPYHTDPLMAGYSVSFGISLFHTLFNVTNTLIQVWFIPDIIKIVTWMVPGKKEEVQDEFRLTYISHGYMNTAELSLQAAKKEVEEFADLVMSMYKLLPSLRTTTDEDEFNKLFARIERYEALTDRMELELTNYLTHINGSDLSQQGGQLISTLLRIIDNLESIGDSILQLAITRKNKRDTAVHFDQSLNDNLAHMDGLVQQALNTMLDNLHGDYDQIDLGKAYGAEAAINKYRDQLRERHLVALKQGTYDYAIGTAYSSLYELL